MVLPMVTESLAGRMETITLLPLSQSEICGETVNWLDSVFAGKIPDITLLLVGNDLIEVVVKGGYPGDVSLRWRHDTAPWQEYLGRAAFKPVGKIKKFFVNIKMLALT